jgi:hypothetical protein
VSAGVLIGSMTLFVSQEDTTSETAGRKTSHAPLGRVDASACSRQYSNSKASTIDAHPDTPVLFRHQGEVVRECGGFDWFDDFI